MSDDPDRRELVRSALNFPRTDHLRDEIEDFALAIRSDRPTEIGTREACRNLAAVLASVRSAGLRRIVEVGEIMGDAVAAGGRAG